jgi:hypothetical protein
VRLSDIESRFVCCACGERRVDVRPNFNWNARGPVGGMGYRTIADAIACCRRTPPLSNYIPWLWNTFWQLLLSFVRFCCKHC